MSKHRLLLRLIRLLILVLFLLSGKIVFPQPDSIWTLSAEKQMNSLLKWYYDDLLKKDSQQVITELIAAEKLFTGQGNETLQRQAWLMNQLLLFSIFA